MSALLFPVLPGLTFDVVRTPVWHTERQQALSGKRSTLAYMQYPLMHFELTYSILRDDIAISEIRQIVGLFNALASGYDTFLFTDPDNNAVAAQPFATGNGTAGPFPLVATYGAAGYTFNELIQNTNGAPQIFDNGSLLVAGTNYTIDAVGNVTFLAGHFPVAGHSLTWTGAFYYRCAFDEDKLDLVKFMNKWWTIKKLPFTSVKL